MNLLPQILSLGRIESQNLFKQVNEFYEKNTLAFLNSLDKDEAQKSKDLMSQGIVWDSAQLWTKIYRCWKSQHTSEEMSAALYMAKPDAVFPSNTELRLVGGLVKLDDKVYNHIKETKSFQKFCNSLIIKEMSPQESASLTNMYVLRHIYFNLRPELEKESVFNNFCKSFAAHDIFANKEIFDYIIERSPTKLLYFMNHSKNLNAEMFSNFYSKTSFTEAEKKTAFDNVLQEGNNEKIKLCLDLGFTLPVDKKSYSSLFSTDKKIDSCRTVLSKLDDITVGNNVILKTVLHHKNNSILGEVLNKYPKSYIPELSQVLEGREETYAVKMVKNFISAYHLDRSLPVKLSDISKPKI